LIPVGDKNVLVLYPKDNWNETTAVDDDDDEDTDGYSDGVADNYSTAVDVANDDGILSLTVPLSTKHSVNNHIAKQYAKCSIKVLIWSPNTNVRDVEKNIQYKILKIRALHSSS